MYSWRITILLLIITLTCIKNVIPHLSVGSNHSNTVDSLGITLRNVKISIWCECDWLGLNKVCTSCPVVWKRLLTSLSSIRRAVERTSGNNLNTPISCYLHLDLRMNQSFVVFFLLLRYTRMQYNEIAIKEKYLQYHSIIYNMKWSIKWRYGKFSRPIQLDLIYWHWTPSTIWSPTWHWSPGWSVSLMSYQRCDDSIFIHLPDISTIGNKDFTICTNSDT